MLLTDEEVEKYIINISTGEKYLLLDDDAFIIFKYPSNFDLQKSEFIYDCEYKKAIDSGLLSTSDLQDLIDKRNLFSDKDELDLNKLKNQFYGQEVLLAKTVVVKANQERIKTVMEGINKKIHELEFKKTSKLALSADTKANEEKTLFLCWASTYSDMDNLYWAGYNDFKCSSKLTNRDSILSGFLRFYTGISTVKIRFIARSNMWRIRYINSQKSLDCLFNKPSVEYTKDMLNLAYWSNYYDNIYQMMPEDRPSDLIIEDDVSLDAFMKSYYEERNREDAHRKSTRKTGSKLSAFDKEEVIVTASNELYNDIEYNKPKEAQRLKDRTDIRKRTKRRR